MKVLLIRPSIRNIAYKINLVKTEPLELEYLYTVAKEEGYDCSIYDEVICKREIEDVIREYNPDIIGITGYITHVGLIRDYARRIKDVLPKSLVIIGGVHAERNYKEFYEGNADLIIHSGGVLTFREILQKIRKGTKLTDTKGICYRKTKNEWVYNELVYIDPNQIPIPDRTFFNENKQHFKYMDFSPCAILKASYSCPHKCNFCYCTQLNGGQYTCRSVESVVEEIEGIHAEYIWIVDDTFYVEKNQIDRFIELIRQKGINKKFIVYYRADFIVKNEELIAALKSIGVFIILVGIEALDDSLLKEYDKNSSLQINNQCLEILKKYDIICTSLFIVDVGATRKDFKRLHSYLKKWQLNYSTIAVLTPIPGSANFDRYEDKLITHNREKWDFMHLVVEPTAMNRIQFYMEYYKLYVRLAFMNKKLNALNLEYIKQMLLEAKVFVKERAKEFMGANKGV